MRDPPTNVGVITDSCVEPFAEGNGPPMILIIVVVVVVAVVAVVAVVVVVAGKAGKTGPGQTKPRQGTTSKPATVRPKVATLESGPRLSSVESGPRLPSEKAGQVAAAMVAAAGALAPAGAYGVNAGMARTRGKAGRVL